VLLRLSGRGGIGGFALRSRIRRSLILWRLAIFNIVGRRGVGRRFRLCRLFRRPEASRAVVAAVLDIVGLGHRRDHGSSAGDLTNAVENNLWSPVVEFDRTVDFDDAACQTPHIANIFQIVRENHDRERARHLIFAEVEKVNACGTHSNAQDFAGHAPGFADMLTGFSYGNAIGCGAEGRQTPSRDNK